MKKNKKSKFFTVISVILVILSLSFLLFTLIIRSDDGVSLFGYRLYRITTGSMEPTLKAGTVIIIHTTEADELKLGDIISFRSSDPDIYGKVNTHRIYAIENDGKRKIFTTIGDAHLSVDKYKVDEKNVIGKVVFSSVKMGKILGFLSDKKVSFFLTVFPLFIIVIIYFIEFVISIYRPNRKDKADGGDK